MLEGAPVVGRGAGVLKILQGKNELIKSSKLDCFDISSRGYTLKVIKLQN